MQLGANIHALLTIPIAKFSRSIGCCTGKNSKLLSDENVGKNFFLKILDPIKIGRVIYLGNETTLIEKMPEFPQPEQEDIYYFISRNPKCWAVFSKKVGTCTHFIIVRIEHLDVQPLFKILQ